MMNFFSNQHSWISLAQNVVDPFLKESTKINVVAFLSLGLG